MAIMGFVFETTKENTRKTWLLMVKSLTGGNTGNASVFVWAYSMN